jgi:hypothetical protein
MRGGNLMFVLLNTGMRGYELYVAEGLVFRLNQIIVPRTDRRIFSEINPPILTGTHIFILNQLHKNT